MRMRNYSSPTPRARLGPGSVINTARTMLLLLNLLLLVLGCTARPDGPPALACNDMRPRHGTIEAQTSAAPVVFNWNTTDGAVIQPELYIRVTLEFEAGRTFKGFMIQARETTAGSIQQQPIGRFIAGDDSKTLQCGGSSDDTSVHPNNNTKHFVIVIWVAPQEVPDEFRFYYTVVEQYDTFWVMQASSGKLLGRTEPLPGDVMYIKIHGSLMALAWGVLIPVGIILALFYKVVWPDGQWFYIHIAVMIAAVLVVIIGLLMILVHSEWEWLNTTDLNSSHQALGIVALVAVVVNPLLALFLICECCSLGTKWRMAYNFFHGSIGLFLAEGVALCAMLIGVHILRDHPRGFDADTVHSAIYSVSAIAATVIMTLVLYNGYHIRYHKDHLKPGSDGMEDPQSSKDWWLRLIAGAGIIVLLLAPVVASIYFISSI